MIYLCLSLFVLSVAYAGWSLTARGAYESAEYVVVESEGAFEIREYPDLMMATTDMKSESQGDDGSFMRLFGYISGANEDRQKVSMTTPVFMESAENEENGQMAFVIPKGVAQQRVPEPSSDNVRIRKRSGGRFAVIRFAGRMSSKTTADAKAKLLKWIVDQGLAATDEVEFAGYDPPWTPGPLRRNEVLIRLHRASEQRAASNTER